MAPERLNGDYDERFDIYALCVILFYALTGEIPFAGRRAGGSVPQLLQRIAKDHPPSARHYRADVPEWLDTLCLRGLQKQPDDRFQAAVELSRSLRDGVAAR
jgi:serine/threonine-protein kinase